MLLFLCGAGVVCYALLLLFAVWCCLVLMLLLFGGQGHDLVLVRYAMLSGVFFCNRSYFVKVLVNGRISLGASKW